MQGSGSGRKQQVAAGLIGAGGILALVSYATHWATFTYPNTLTSTVTVHVGHRGIGLWFGALLLLRAVMASRLAPAQARRWGGFALLSAGFIGGYAIYDMFTEQSRAVSALVANTAAQLNLPVSQVKTVIDQQVARGIIHTTFTGAWLALAAAALAAVGAVWSLKAPIDAPTQSAMPEPLARPFEPTTPPATPEEPAH